MQLEGRELTLETTVHSAVQAIQLEYPKRCCAQKQFHSSFEGSR